MITFPLIPSSPTCERFAEAMWENRKVIILTGSLLLLSACGGVALIGGITLSAKIALSLICASSAVGLAVYFKKEKRAQENSQNGSHSQPSLRTGSSSVVSWPSNPFVENRSPPNISETTTTTHPSTLLQRSCAPSIDPLIIIPSPQKKPVTASLSTPIPKVSSFRKVLFGVVLSWAYLFVEHQNSDETAETGFLQMKRLCIISSIFFLSQVLFPKLAGPFQRRN